jgi:hypothetical protein
VFHNGRAGTLVNRLKLADTACFPQHLNWSGRAYPKQSVQFARLGTT